MTGLHGLLRPWSDAELESIHQASLSLLETTGVYVAGNKVLEYLETAGAKVDRNSGTVRFPRDMVQDRLENSPGCWDRCPSTAGEFHVTADAGTSTIWDYGLRQARPVTPKDLVDVPRLVQALPHIDGAGTLVASGDVPAGMRDIVFCRNRMIHCCKDGGGGLGRFPSLANDVGVEAFDDLYDLLSAADGTAEPDSVRDLSFFMGAASPLRWGEDVLETAGHVVEKGHVVGIGGNCICGMQSPITPASNIMIDHAERLSGLCIVTSIRQDAHFYFCNHTYCLDMESEDVAHGSPEQALLPLLGRRLLEHLGFNPVVAHPILDTGSHTPDPQAGAEKAMYMLLAALGGARAVGGAGQLKETVCYEQLVIDNEIAGYVKHLLKGAGINENTIALETVNELGTGGNFLTSEPTLEFLRECYYPPQLFYRKRMSEWIREGAKDILETAHEKMETILSSETPVFLDADRITAMDEVIERARRRVAPGWDAGPFLPQPY